jgi:hypothetical protein
MLKEIGRRLAHEQFAVNEARVNLNDSEHTVQLSTPCALPLARFASEHIISATSAAQTWHGIRPASIGVERISLARAPLRTAVRNCPQSSAACLLQLRRV